MRDGQLGRSLIKFPSGRSLWRFCAFGQVCVDDHKFDCHCSCTASDGIAVAGRQDPRTAGRKANAKSSSKAPPASQDAEALSTQGRVAAENHRLPEAVKFFQQAATVAPAESSYASNAAYSLHQIGRHSEALEWFDRSLALTPNSDDAWAKRGDAARMQANKFGRDDGSNQEALAAMFEESSRCYEEALDLNPNNGMAVSGRDRVKAVSIIAPPHLPFPLLAWSC